jgi:hypothetical protein
LFLSCLHLAVGVVLLGCSSGAKSWSQDYSCDGQSQPELLVFHIGEALSGQFFLYYELEGFQQNHFRFASSWSADQMRGLHVSAPTECRPFVLGSDRANLLNFTPDSESEMNATLFPCGLMPNFFFNDSYKCVEVNCTEEGISWPKEIGNLFKTPEPVTEKTNKEIQTLTRDVTDEHFVVWMRTAKAATFRKLYARFDDDSLATDISVKVTCNFPVNWFSGQRRVVIMRMGGFGGKNIFLGLLNIGLFVLCGIFAVFFKKQCCSCVKDDERPHNIPGHPPLREPKVKKKKCGESDDIPLNDLGMA